MQAETPARAPAVRRAASILWLLADRAGAMSLSQISRSLDIIPSTALHILRELVSARLVSYDSEQKIYRLGQGIIDLAQIAIKTDSFVEIARPHLQAIASSFNVSTTATAGVDENHVALVDFVTPPDAVYINLTVGGRVPTFSGAAGRCIAAYSGKTEAQLQRAFSKIRWNRPLTFKKWISQVRSAKKEGIAEDVGYFALGVTTLAVPVFSPNGDVTRVIGTVSITAQLEAMKKSELIAALKAAAQDISGHLMS